MAAISKNAQQGINDQYHRLLSSAQLTDQIDKVLLSYSGGINQSRIDAILGLTESSIIDHGSKRKVMKRVCTILIECLQNISFHGTKDDNGEANCYITIRQNAENIFINTGNLILSEDANLLAYKLEELNKLSEAELRKLYIETLCNQNFSYKGGAGLGFLTIAKKAAQPIKYELQSLNEKFSYFSSEIVVARS